MSQDEIILSQETFRELQNLCPLADSIGAIDSSNDGNFNPQISDQIYQNNISLFPPHITNNGVHKDACPIEIHQTPGNILQQNHLPYLQHGVFELVPSGYKIFDYHVEEESSLYGSSSTLTRDGSFPDVHAITAYNRATGQSNIRPKEFCESFDFESEVYGLVNPLTYCNLPISNCVNDISIVPVNQNQFPIYDTPCYNNGSVNTDISNLFDNNSQSNQQNGQTGFHQSQASLNTLEALRSACTLSEIPSNCPDPGGPLNFRFVWDDLKHQLCDEKQTLYKDVFYSKNLHKLYAKNQIPVPFTFTFNHSLLHFSCTKSGGLRQTSSQLWLKIMPVFKELCHIQYPVLTCALDEKFDPFLLGPKAQGHFLVNDSPDTLYVSEPGGGRKYIYFRIPYPAATSSNCALGGMSDSANEESPYTFTVPLTFSCFNSCKGGINMKTVQLIFTLLEATGPIDVITNNNYRYLARSVVEIRICAAPLRDFKKEAHIHSRWSFKAPGLNHTPATISSKGFMMDGLEEVSPSTSSIHSKRRKSCCVTTEKRSRKCVATTTSITPGNVTPTSKNVTSTSSKNAHVHTGYDPISLNCPLISQNANHHDRAVASITLSKFDENGSQNQIVNDNTTYHQKNHLANPGNNNDNSPTNIITSTSINESNGGNQYLIIQNSRHYEVVKAILERLEESDVCHESLIKKVCQSLNTSNITTRNNATSNNTHTNVNIPVLEDIENRCNNNKNLTHQPFKKQSHFNHLNTDVPPPIVDGGATTPDYRTSFAKQFNLTPDQMASVSNDLVKNGVKFTERMMSITRKLPHDIDIQDLPYSHPTEMRKIMDALMLWSRDLKKLTTEYSLSQPSSLSSQQLLSDVSQQESVNFAPASQNISSTNPALQSLSNGLLLYRYRFKHTIRKS